MVEGEEVPLVKTEREISSYLQEHLEELIPGIKVLSASTEYKSKDSRIDLLLDAEIGGIRKKLVCEIKSVGEPRYLYQAIAQLKSITSFIENGYPVVIASYISERGREICKENGIGYVDLSGNVFLNFDGVYIEKTGKEKLQKGKSKLKSLFYPVSSRIIRVFLEDPQKEWRINNLSKEANASLGYVHKVVSTLQEQGYLQRSKNGVKVSEPEKLLDMWSKEYKFSLNKMYSFYSFVKEPAKMMQRIEETSKKLDTEYAMTMHAGASLIAPFVRFTDVHFYITGEFERWVKELDLKPVEFGGTIHLLKPYDSGIFYKARIINSVQVVSNIQLYLDLYNYPARGKEQAEFLRKEKIKY